MSREPKHHSQPKKVSFDISHGTNFLDAIKNVGWPEIEISICFLQHASQLLRALIPVRNEHRLPNGLAFVRCVSKRPPLVYSIVQLCSFERCT